MRRALEIAEAGRGAVEPNPLVGAVVVREDQVLGEGFHARFGGPHAEVEALNRAGDASGADLYVTLEPCCHHGKTPPCVDRILESGIRRVVAAMRDPFPRVAGGGFSKLREAGVEVEVGLFEDEARSLNAPYSKLLDRGRPYVHAKWAMTLDGRIATSGGESQWISNETSRRHAHAFRGLVDAILVGVGTVLADDPRLTARPPGPRIATRVVLDSTARLPTNCQLVRSAREIPVLVATTERAPDASVREWTTAGCEVLRFESGADGRVPLGPLLDTMGVRRWTNVLVEGGAGVLGAFLLEGEIDAVRVYLAPQLVGGSAALGPVGGVGIRRLADAMRFMDTTTVSLDGDLFLSARRPVPATNSDTHHGKGDERA